MPTAVTHATRRLGPSPKTCRHWTTGTGTSLASNARCATSPWGRTASSPSTWTRYCAAPATSATTRNAARPATSSSSPGPRGWSSKGSTGTRTASPAACAVPRSGPAVLFPRMASSSARTATRKSSLSGARNAASRWWRAASSTTTRLGTRSVSAATCATSRSRHGRFPCTMATATVWSATGGSTRGSATSAPNRWSAASTSLCRSRASTRSASTVASATAHSPTRDSSARD